MTVLEIIFAIALLIFSVAIILVVLLQEGNQKNMGVVTGAADSFLAKNKASARSINAFLSKWTKVIAIGFFVLVLVANAVMYFVK